MATSCSAGGAGVPLSQNVLSVGVWLGEQGAKSSVGDAHAAINSAGIRRCSGTFHYHSDGDDDINR